MEIAIVGLGRMGAGIASRLLKSKHRVVVWNRSKQPVNKLKKKGAVPSESIEDMVSKLRAKRKIVWVMLPAGKVTEEYIEKVSEFLGKDDIIIDGGNANFHDSIKRSNELEKRGIIFMDVGVSGGLEGANRGYCMMIGGDKTAFNYMKPLFKSMCMKNGFDYMGESGSGHYVKMVHNSVEYGMMQAIAEGFDLIKNGRFKNLNVEKIAKVWNNGSIVESYIMKMVENSFRDYGNLRDLKPFVEESGEGRWAVQEAIEQKIPYVANTYALNARYTSKIKSSFAMKLLAAIRNEFGGHKVKKQ